MLLEFRKLHTQTPLNCPPSCEDSVSLLFDQLRYGEIPSGFWFSELLACGSCSNFWKSDQIATNSKELVSEKVLPEYMKICDLRLSF
jgi:hypothetical protein